MFIVVLVVMIVLTLAELFAIVGATVLWARGNHTRAKLGMDRRGSVWIFPILVFFVGMGWVFVSCMGGYIPIGIIALVVWTVLRSILPVSDFPGVYDKDRKPVKSPCGWESDGGTIAYYPGHTSWDTTSHGLFEYRAFKSGQTIYYAERTIYGYDVTMPLEITGLPDYWLEFDVAVVREETLLERLVEEQLTARPLSPGEGREACIEHLQGVLTDVARVFLASERTDVQVCFKQSTVRPPAVRRSLG